MPSPDPDRIRFHSTCFKALAYVLLVAALMQGVLMEARQPIQQEFSEIGFTELMQSVLLLLATLLALGARYCYQQMPHVTLLLAGLFGASLIREQDMWLDHYVFDGAWQCMVSLWVIPILFVVIRGRTNFIREMESYSGTFSFGLFAAGFLTTYAFSRLFGRGELWQAMLEDAYLHVFKNAAEEVSELFGYTLLVLAMVELILLIRRRISTDG